jgi:hypothetical protein
MSTEHFDDLASKNHPVGRSNARGLAVIVMMSHQRPASFSGLYPRSSARNNTSLWTRRGGHRCGERGRSPRCVRWPDEAGRDARGIAEHYPSF